MFQLALYSFRQIFRPEFRAILLKSIGLSLLLLIVAGIGMRAGLAKLVLAYNPPFAGWLEAAAGLMLVFLAAYLLAPVSSLVAGFFLDDVAEKIERADYPADPPGKAMALWPAIVMSLRFAALIAAVNFLALLCLLIPGVNLSVFLVANAYLLGREYFELAACRFRPREEARAMRRHFAPRIFFAGLLIALMLSVPLLNLVTPLFGMALMVHLHKRLGRLPA